jgi:hypothetical protein
LLAPYAVLSGSRDFNFDFIATMDACGWYVDRLDSHQSKSTKPVHWSALFSIYDDTVISTSVPQNSCLRPRKFWQRIHCDLTSGPTPQEISTSSPASSCF